MSKVEINDKFWLRSNINGSLSNLKGGLEQYLASFDKATTLQTFPLFLDANVLLDFYKVSNKIKSNFIKFLTSNINNIYITEQVKNEYLKSRINVINKDYLDAITSVPKQLEKDVNTISRFIEANKAVLNDYGEIYSDLKAAENQLQSTLHILSSEVQKDLDKNKNIKYNDPLLKIYSEIKVIKNLSDNELEFLTSKFIELSKQKTIIYPGKSDIKEKGASAAAGDFIIFHEVMKFMKEKETSIVFLTNDTKEDWFEIDKKRKNPLLAYIEATYNSTGYFNYILEANRSLSDIMKVDIDSNSYFKIWNKQNELLKQKTFVYDWADEAFLSILSEQYIDQFTVPVSQIELEDNVQLSNIDFDSVLDNRGTTADFFGDGTAFNSDDTQVSYYVNFSFHGECDIDIERGDIDILDIVIDEHSVDVANKDSNPSLTKQATLF